MTVTVQPAGTADHPALAPAVAADLPLAPAAHSRAKRCLDIVV